MRLTFTWSNIWLLFAEKSRANRGNSPIPIVVSVDALRLYNYDGACSLPYRPSSNGLRYIGINQ